MTDDVGNEDDGRLDRLVAGLHQVEAEHRRSSVERTLVLFAGALVPIGILLVLVGWHGASRTPNLHEQIPYMISGAQLGQTLAIVGALLYFASWVAVLARQQGSQGAAITSAIEHLEGAVIAALSDQTSSPGPDARVATARGKLAHRPGCAAVVGRPGLRPVTVEDGLEECQLCSQA